MRGPLVRSKLERFLEALGRAARGPGRLYLTGGATAVTYGWRASTLDVDLRLFLPEVPGWRERSVFVARYGQVDVFHYDPVSQTLSKLARAHERDLADAEAMVDAELATRASVAEGFAAIEPELVRFPRIEAALLAARVRAFTEGPR